MKILKKLLLLVLCFTIFSCIINKENDLIENEINEFSRIADNVSNSIKYSKNELIIQYKSGVNQAKKQNARLLHSVLSYEVCDLCPGGLIEKWSFPNTINLENKKLSIKSGSGGPEGIILNLESEFSFAFEQEVDLSLINSNNPSYAPQIVNQNNGVTIAVLDSGIDANYPLFNIPFLYNASNTNVIGEPSGWDFVNHDDNCFDDYNLIHGTKVSYIINNRLNNFGIPHQILPVKVCDTNGSASYFDILCGLKYALPRAKIIQMSLGWYDNNTSVNSIFMNLVEQYENDVLIVTSAGNSGTDNDVSIHYPSSYPQDNILAIAASNETNSDIAWFSNYGIQSVDFYAPGENVLFYNIFNKPVSISGTSFSAPLVTAIAAEIIYNSGIPLQPMDIISNLQAIGTPVQNYYTHPVKYNKLLQ